MSFDTGSMTFQRFAVVGIDAPKTPTDELLAKLGDHQLKIAGVGVPEAVEWGWSGARHVMDVTFDFEYCVFNDCVHFGLRIDTNKVPAELIKAWRLVEEQAAAAANPSGFLSKSQKREAKDAIARKVEGELRSGKYRRSKLIALLWDVPAGVLYGPTGVAARDMLRELFARTFALELHPLTSGRVGEREFSQRNQRRAYEDLMPTRFAKSQEDPNMPAEYPWTANGDGEKDFLGNEFLLWLWYQTQKNGVIRTGTGDCSVMFDRSLQLDCGYGQSGKDTLAATGPTRMAEAFDGLRSGKVPRRAGLIVDVAGGQFNLTLAGDSFAVSSLKLPEIEKADTARTLFEERITLLRDFCGTLDGLFGLFLQSRTIGWSQLVDGISKWIKAGKA